MSPRRALIFLGLIAAGYALIIPGQLAIVHVDQAVIWVVTHFGDGARWLVNRTAPGLPPGAVMAILCVVLGAALVAVGVAIAAAPATTSSDDFDQGGDDPVGLCPGAALLLSGFALATITAYLCMLEPPTNLAVLTWAASIVAGGLAFFRVDRYRHTSLRLPLADRREAALVLAMMALSLLVVTHDLMSWRWSGTPDESNFFGVAKAMADGEAERFLLSERGVFEVHPTLSSAYQAVFMWFLGSTGFAWRFSSAAALAASLPALYVLARLLWNRRVATIATLLFGTTPVAVGFAHLGYNNTQLYPVVLGSLALTAWAHRCGSAAGFYLAACLAAFGFYSYYPARLAPALVIWLAVCLGAFAWRGFKRAHVAAVIVALVLTLVPVALHPQETLTRMFQFTSFTSGGAAPVSDFTSLWQRLAAADFGGILRHTFMSLVYSVYFVGPHHFQWPPVVDPVSGPLTLVGLGLCLGGVRRRNACFLAGTFIAAALLVCATSHYFRPPLTRLLFLSPFAALLAAIAVDRLAAGLSAAGRARAVGSMLAVAITAAAVLWGIAALQYNVRYRYHGYGDGTTAELVRLALQQPDDTHVVYVQRIDTSMWSVDEIFAQYGVKERLTYLRGFDDTAQQALAALQPPFLVVLALGDEGERLAAEALLARRFPSATWRSSDPEQVWNLRYLEVAAASPR